MVLTDRIYLLFYLLLLTAFFALLEFSFFIQCNQAYLADFSSVAAKIDIPLSIVPSVLIFMLTHLMVHAIFAFFVWFIACQCIHVFKISESYHLIFSMSLWLLGMLTILLANQLYYPQSKFAELTSTLFFNEGLAYFLFLLAGTLCLFLLLIALIQIFYRYPWGLVFLCMFVGGYFFYTRKAQPISAISSPLPNVIMIGVDGLRPDFLSHFGSEQETHFLDHWLKHATVFTEALTPLARTFPSWVGVLTGKYPKEIGIRSNLVSVKQALIKSALSFELRKHGYHTIYATDETRFSNIDSTFGFDQTVSPPMGLKDFLLGTFNDFPITNLLVNSPLGPWLFPYSNANRGVFFTYDPIRFVDRVVEKLPHSTRQPLFLATHFCLPHFPYIWRMTPRALNTPLQRYAQSIEEVDRQISYLFKALDEKNLLRNAIVILLSDHGEALELVGDRITTASAYEGRGPIPHFYPPSLEDEKLDQSAGHGTDVLGLPQYHTLLAVRLYGMGPQHVGEISGRVSLLDVRSTVLSLLNFSYSPDSGRSLDQLIKNKITETYRFRDFFLESDFSPQSIRTVYPQMNKVVLEGVALFQVDPVTLRLTFKPAMTEKILKSKQYADLYQNWLLALYPQSLHTQIPVLVNLKTGHWTACLTTQFAQNSPAQRMVQALQKFYGREIRDISQANCG